MTKNKLVLTGMALLLMFNAAKTLAAEPCSLVDQATPDEAKSYIQCLDKQLETLTRIQQTWINKITLDLNKIEEDTGNTQLLPIFKRSITSQKKYLEDSCKWRYLQKVPNAIQAAIVYKRCELQILEQHITVLKRPLK
ncbi:MULTISPECIES: hypothetical protein [Pseudoalteromonas]|uniref:hypothetical protein n=1 Tax=Pseudoalteromonas TaxID=53246 RepID=UPI0002EF8EB5|nr:MULTISPECIES: hypothetical protein [Pseudoalteromonas]MCF6142750.1 hypothetical protein [Pseudoalteromonas mariniglutinosa NCIMB 1770]